MTRALSVRGDSPRKSMCVKFSRCSVAWASLFSFSLRDATLHIKSLSTNTSESQNISKYERSICAQNRRALSGVIEPLVLIVRERRSRSVMSP